MNQEKCVLVVDDEPAVTRLLTFALQQAGFRVQVAADGVEGLEFFRGHPGRISAIVSDLLMPRMNGLDMALRVRESDPSLPIVLISGYSDDVLQARAQTSFPLFRKPFLPTELIAVLEDLLSRDDKRGAD